MSITLSGNVSAAFMVLCSLLHNIGKIQPILLYQDHTITHNTLLYSTNLLIRCFYNHPCTMAKMNVSKMTNCYLIAMERNDCYHNK